MRGVTPFRKRRPKLRVNAAKSAVGRPWERKFLGYSNEVAQEAEGSLQRAIERLNLVLRHAGLRGSGKSQLGSTNSS